RTSGFRTTLARSGSGSASCSATSPPHPPRRHGCRRSWGKRARGSGSDRSPLSRRAWPSFLLPPFYLRDGIVALVFEVLPVRLGLLLGVERVADNPLTV